MKQKVYRAGVIPYFITPEGTVEMLFMVPTNSYKKWGSILPQIAKGKIEEGEDTKVAAFREAKEELGLFSGNVIQDVELGTVLGRTTIYLAQIRDKDLFGDPRTDETESVMWLTLEEFKKIGRPLHIPVVKAANRMIENQLALNNKKGQ